MPASKSRPGTAHEAAEFLTAHPDFDLAGFDSYDRDTVTRLGLPESRSATILAGLRARQRIARITDDPATATALIGAGLDSAHLIAAMPAHRFAREHAGLFGGDEFAARQAHERAQAVTAAVSHLYANLHGVLGSPHFAALHGNHADDSLAKYFSDIPSYQDLFGRLDSCSCQHCGSIFGPAAYFTDLMRIIDDYITDVNTGIPAGYRLAERRPDLFELPLTCANTNDLVPMLQIVNTILARRIAAAGQATSGTAQAGGTSSITLAATSSPDDDAYTGMMIMIVSGAGTGQVATITSYAGATRLAEVGQRWGVVPDATSGYVVATDPYLTVASAPYPFNLPWNQPLAQARASLSTLRTTLPEIYLRYAAPVTGGTARGGTATAVTLAAGASPDDGAYDTMTVALIGGTGAGQVRIVTGYDGAARQATVARPWGTVPDDTTQYHVTDTLGADREQLGLSVEQYAIVTTPVTTGPALAPYYGLQEIDLAQLSHTEEFQARTGLSLAQVTALLTQGLSKAELASGVAGGFFINATGENLPAMRLGVDSADPNAPVSVIENLSLARLDRLNRFIRLAMITGWGYEELGWAMVSVAAAEITEAAIKSFAGISRLVARTGLTVTQLTAFWWPLKTTGRGNGRVPADLFDRVFNAPAVLAGQDPYTSVTPIPFDPARPLSWDPAVTTGQDGVIRGRLSAALTVGDDDLTRLAVFVQALGGGTGPLSLTLDTLTWLYRLSSAARIFRLTLDEYLILLGLMYYPGQAAPEPGSLVPTVDAVLAQAERVDWFTRTDFTVYSVLYVLEGIRTPYYRPPYAPDDIAPFITSLATAAEGARLTTESFVYGPVTTARSQQVFQGLVAESVITSLGLLLDNGPRYQQAALMFPLRADSFVSAEITPEQSAAAFAELVAADPPVLEPVTGAPELATLSRSFTAETDLSFLFTGAHDAANERNQVRTVLLNTRQCIDVTEFAFLFPITPASFTSRAVPANQSAHAFSQLTAHEPPYILADPAAGQQRRITGYDGGTRVATVTPIWSPVPGTDSAYVITTEVTTGTAVGGGLFTVTLDAEASPDDGAYAGMTIVITSGTGAGEQALIADYDGSTKTATTVTPWVRPPDATSAYTVTAETDAGLVQDADETHLTLDQAASLTNGLYDGMQVTIVTTGRLSADFGAGTDLSFLFGSQGAGQSRPVTGYDGATRTATVAPGWQTVPDDTSYYQVTRVVQQGTATGGGSSTIVLGSGASRISSSYDGMTVTLTGGTGTGQSATVTAYDGETATATVAPPWTTMPDTTTTYDMVEVVTQGTARGGDATQLFLAADASADSGAYDGMTLSLVADPAADFKRGEVAQVLLSVLSEIEHTADIIGAADVLQQGYAMQGLADFFGTAPGRLAALIPFASRAADLAGYLDDLLTPIQDGQVPPEVPPFVAALSRGLVLFDTLDFSVAQMLAVTEIPKAFNITDRYAFTFDDITSLSVFTALEREFGDTTDELLEYFRRPNDTACPGPKTEALAALSGWPVAQICQLGKRLWPDGLGQSAYDLTTVDGLGRLSACFDLVTRTGLDVGSLLQLDSLAALPVAGGGGVLGGNWQAYQAAAQLALDAVRARFGEPEFSQVNAETVSTLNEAARDALLGYAVWVLNATDPLITDASSLYEYLLIDVEVAGCAQTSPVVQGIAALQLYLQRCRLMLEPGVTNLSEVGPAWWEWMSAYRIWEANRRIFLYPENYLQPSLRQGASPEFDGLAQTLLESDVTERSAAAAYQNYFEAFAVTGNLVICDAYQCPVPKAGTKVVRAQGAVAAATATTVTLGPEASDLYNAYAGLRVSITSGTGSGQVREIITYSGRVATVNPAWGTVPDTSSRYVVTGPQLLDTLFLVGRTNTEPPVYYHRRFDPRQGWVPWREVGITIPAPVVTPVYAFDRLHLFWTEQRAVESSKITSSGGNPTSTALSSVSASVRYAYLDTDGTWSTAQNAAPDLVSDYQQNYTLDTYVKSLLPGLAKQFNPRVLYWQKAQPLHIPAAKVTQPQLYPNGEQVLLNYGLSMGFAVGQPISPPDPPDPAMPAQQYAFENGAYQLVTRYNTMVQAPIQTATGFLQLMANLAVSGALTRTPVSAAFINYLPLQFPQPYNAALIRGTGPAGKLVVAKSSTWNIIVDNYWWDSYPGLVDVLPPPNDPVLPLLANLSSRDAMVASVKNMPGSFIVGNGDETFLVRSSDTGIRAISDVVTASAESAPFPAGFYYLRTASYTSTKPAPDPFSLQYGFTRLSTRAARELSERLARGVIPDLLSLDAQRSPELPFSRLAPTASVVPPATDQLDFDGAYGPYFWEIFFHAPLLTAEALGAGRRFREAKTWLEYIYNPTQQPEPGDEGKERYWRFLPLRTMDLPTLTQILASPAQISAYNDDPFDPDAIARLRISAYAKAVVMRYVDNLLNWGDHLFTQDTRESVDEATNLYVLALNLLGPRPQVLGDCEPPAPASYNDIKQAYNNRTITIGVARSAGPQTITLAESASELNDAYTGMNLTTTSGAGSGQVGYIVRYDGATRTASMEAPWSTQPSGDAGYEVFVNGVPQFLIRLENSAPAIAATQAGASYQGTPFNDIGTYFCVPENDQLIGYWDRAEDRLFKIRHCMNIDGVVRTLQLFAPPVNPAALVGAAASGSASPAVVPQLNLPVPFYRFTVLIQRAKELAGAVAGLGAELLAALEKKDAEALALLQVSQQQVLLDMTTAIKELAIEQTAQTSEALAAALASAQERQAYYAELIAVGLSPAEVENIIAMHSAADFNLSATITRVAASLGFAVPQFGSPFAMTYGGQQIGSVLSAAAGVLDAGAVLKTFDSQLALTMSQYERRDSDWTLQEGLAAHDVAQILAQIAANQTQQSIAERDLAVHLTALAQNQAVSRFLTTKFTNQELYQWMSTRLSGLHFQTYALALELARSAQRAFQYELNGDTTFVNFSYWDGARRGLLAGEGLLLALNQMEKAYTERNTRALQIEKTISLASLDPLALRDLIETGECVFALTEKLFDDDYPGHYARKISTLSVSIPAITGPYQNLHASLTQLANQVVIAPNVNAANFLLGGESATLPGPDALRTDWWVNQQIAISTGLGDDGVFDTNPMDGRLLPFEGTGAVSTWRLSLPRQTNHFDFNAVSDVILTLRYQAFDGGARFREQVVRLPAMSSYTGSVRLPLAQVFSSQWYEFLHAPDDPDQQSLDFTLADLVPPHISAPVLTGFSLHLQVPDGTATAGREPYLRLRLGTALDTTFNLNTHADHTQVVNSRPRIATVEGAGSLAFILAKTPDDLLKPPPPPRYLDPAVLQNATLVLIYQGKITWPPGQGR